MGSALKCLRLELGWLTADDLVSQWPLISPIVGATSVSES